MLSEFPIYSTAAAVLQEWNGCRVADLQRMRSVPVPSGLRGEERQRDWLSSRFDGTDLALLLHIHEITNRPVAGVGERDSSRLTDEPRTRQLAAEYELATADQDGHFRLTARGEAFVRGDPALIGEIDRSEHLVDLLATVAETDGISSTELVRGLQARGLGDATATKVNHRTRNLRARGLLVYEGGVYRITERARAVLAGRTEAVEPNTEMHGDDSTRHRRTPEEWLVAYYLARCGTRHPESGRMLPPPALGARTWNDAFALFYEALGGGREPGRFRNSLKNARDLFDGHIAASGRIGWRQTDQTRRPQNLTSIAQEVFHRWRGHSDDDLLEAVLEVRDGARGAPERPPRPNPEPEHPGRVLPPNPRGATEEDQVLSAAIDDERAARDPDRARRRAEDAKLIGDLGECAVIEYLRQRPDILPGSIDHLAARGETPGWDITCRRTNGEMLYVEVKATEHDRMSNFELTENERAAAERFGAWYSVFAVTSVRERPVVHRLDGFWELISSARVGAKPTRWLVTGIQLNGSPES